MSDARAPSWRCCIAEASCKATRPSLTVTVAVAARRWCSQCRVRPTFHLALTTLERWQISAGIVKRAA